MYVNLRLPEAGEKRFCGNVSRALGALLPYSGGCEETVWRGMHQ